MTNKRGQIYESNIRHAYPFLRRTQSPQSGSFIFKMAVMLQIPQVFPRVSCLRSAKAVQCPCPGPKIGDKSYQIPRYSPVCPWGQPPGMAADKCIINPFFAKSRQLRRRCQCAGKFILPGVSLNLPSSASHWHRRR